MSFIVGATGALNNSRLASSAERRMVGAGDGTDFQAANLERQALNANKDTAKEKIRESFTIG